MITIIGIDPGLAATGVGIVRGNGRNVAGYSFGSISTLKKQIFTKPSRSYLFKTSSNLKK